MKPQHILLISILLLAAFLRFYQLPDAMMFIGDQGWYYLAARDMLLTWNIPLVGIESSHPWLHQGAYWTYILAFLFVVLQFNPLVPSFFVAVLGVITVYLIYRFASKMFNSRVGFIAALLYATSPLILVHERMPYHTSPISVITLLLLYTIYKWINGWVYGFPLAIFLLAALYNFQISTTPLLVVFSIVVMSVFLKKKKYSSKLFTKQILLLSLFAWIIPMLPMLIYDFSHGFPQTVKFVIWIGYKFALFFGFPSIHGEKVFAETVPFLPFTITEIQRLVFLPNAFAAISILLCSILYVSCMIYTAAKHHKYNISTIIVVLSFLVPFLSYLAVRTPSGAYFPMFFPSAIMLMAIAVASIFAHRKLQIIGICIVAFWVSCNVYAFLNSNFLMGKNGYGLTFKERVEKSKEIIKKSKGMRYNIVGKGPGSEFDAFTMNYQYLTWWLGHGPSDKPEKLKIPVSE